MIAPMAVAANVVPNDKPAAKPTVGAKNVLIIDAKTTEKIFQYTFPKLFSCSVIQLISCLDF